MDYYANNTVVIELSGTTSICFFHSDFKVQQANCLSIQLSTHAGVTTGPSSSPVECQGHAHQPEQSKSIKTRGG